MKGSIVTFKPTLLLTALLGGIVLTSCGSPPRQASLSTAGEAPALMSSPAGSSAAKDSAGSMKQTAQSTTAKVPQSRSQLIKKVGLSISVTSINQTLQAVSKIIAQQEGDVFKLEDNKPQNDSTRHTASMEIKIPQEQLETTLEGLEKLGTVKRRTQTAEDVTEQIVDSQARLRNLRQQEVTLLKIMERQGAVGDVLKVAQELSNVRDTIERIDAQLKSLRNQVAYSTITLELEEAIALKPLARPLGSEVQETWDKATNSVGKVTVGLMRLSLWLVAFSPYLLVLAGAAFVYNRRRLQHRNSIRSSKPPSTGIS